VGVIAIFVAPILGRNLHRINLRIAPTIAFSIFAFSLYWVSLLNETATFGQLALPRLLQGMGLPLFFLPLNQIVMSGVSSNELANAAGLSNFIRTISGSIATAVCVWIWNTRTDYHHAVLTESVTSQSTGTTSYLGQLAEHGVSGTSASGYIDYVIGTQASTLGANDVFLLLALLFIVIVPFVWLARPPFGAAGTGGGGH
jgi:DHA2 family multidrug resistance protein